MVPFEELFRHYEEIRRSLERMVRSPHTAADLTQETYLRALRFNRPDFSPRNPGGWLQTMAYHVAFNHKEKMRHARVVFESDTLRAAIMGKCNANAPDADSLGISLKDLRQALAELSPTDRRLLSGFHMEGRTCRELSEELGIRRGYVKVLLFRARKQLLLRLKKTQ